MTRRRPTPSQTVGPFFGFALPFPHGPEAVAPHSRGAVRLEGRVLDGDGLAVPDALLEASSPGQFARSRTDPEGAFHFWLRRPDAVHDGARPAAPHFELTVFARGLLRHLATRIYFPDEKVANAADPVLRKVPPARRSTLIARHDGGVLIFDLHLQGEDETVFFAL
jgi:protocatechuate 3,4-dioxygenase, alpha subunit